MDILYIAHGGFGDVSLTTAWPRMWSERGHVTDVFLMLYTGNPFHKNPYIRKICLSRQGKYAEDLSAMLSEFKYDKIVIINNSNTGVGEIIKLIENKGNAVILETWEVNSNDLTPPQMLPEWHYDKSELDYVLKNYSEKSVVFHPFCSSSSENSRNVDFELIKNCHKYMKSIVVAHGGVAIKSPELPQLENLGIKLLWEGYNCFNDDDGQAIGKLIALTSICDVSVHGWSGSFTIPMGLNKPFVMIVPGDSLRNNQSSPYKETKQVFWEELNYIRGQTGVIGNGYKGCSAWCATNNFNVVITAINSVLDGKSVMYTDNKWISI